MRIGTNAGNGALSTGAGNTFGGYESGKSNSTGTSNVFLGSDTGTSVNGSYNIFIGRFSGSSKQSGASNVFIGYGSGANNLGGYANTFVGHQSGNGATGSSNVFIGQSVGMNQPVDNKLFIDNSNTGTPLIWGDFADDQLKLNGKVGVGAVGTFPTNPLYANYKLFVTGGLLTDEVRIAPSASGTWADYVFADDYHSRPLSEVEAFIAKNKHLPNVPSAAEVKEEGLNLGDMARIQQEKKEELMLYIIAQEKRIQALEAKQMAK